MEITVSTLHELREAIKVNGDGWISFPPDLLSGDDLTDFLMARGMEEMLTVVDRAIAAQKC